MSWSNFAKAMACLNIMFVPLSLLLSDPYGKYLGAILNGFNAVALYLGVGDLKSKSENTG